MARLEIDIALNNLQGATTGLKTLQDSLKQLSGKGVKIEVGGTAIAEAKVQAIQATTAIKEMVASANVNNATFLTKVKAEGIEAKTALTNLNGELKKTETLAKVQGITGLSAEKEKTEQARRALIEYNLEKKKAIDAQKEFLKAQSVKTGEGSIVAMRNRLNELRKVYDNLSSSARNSAKIQNNLVTEINRLNQAVSKAEQGTGRFQRNVGNYENGMRNASGVTMEFNRIIQDAPFGMMGIGNNIQQLASNWQHYTQQARAAAAANGTTVTTMSLVKGVMSSMLSPANLLTLGIAAVTSAWTAYTMWQQRANKSSKETKSAYDKLREGLSSYREEMVKANEAGTQEITKLNRLVSIYNDVNQSQKQRKAAYQDILSIYEDYYGKLSDEEKKTFDLSKAYDKLSVSIIKTSKARGYGSFIDKNSEKIIILEEGINNLSGAISKASLELYNLEKAGKKDGNPRDIYEYQQAQDKLNELLAKNYAMSDAKAMLTSKNYDFEKKILELGVEGAKLAEGEAKKEEDKTRELKQQVDYLQQIKDLVGDKNQELSMFDLKGQAKDLQELSNKYADFYTNLDKLRKKYNADKNKNKQGGVIEGIDSARKTGKDLEDKERELIVKKWNEEYLNLIQDAEIKAGLITENAREKELSNWKTFTEKLRAELLLTGKSIEKVNEDIAKLLSQGTINLKTKFAIEDLSEIDKATEKISELLDKPFTAKNKFSLQQQINERISLFRESAIKLADMMKALGIKVDEEKLNSYINNTSNAIQTQGDKTWALKTAQEFSESMKAEFQNVFSSFFSNLDTNVEIFGRKIGGIFETVAHSLSESIKGLIDGINQKNQAKVFENLMKTNQDGVVDLKTNWSEMLSNTESKMQGIGAALSMAGNAVSSLTKKTSVVGQGLGGALSGAGSMVATGNPYLIAGGALIGAITGIFGAKKAKKQEEMQRKQLEEQKKANALLERMNALAYTSSIIGGQSQYGIVSGVNRNAQGEFTFKIDGRDLVAVMGNNERLIGR